MMHSRHHVGNRCRQRCPVFFVVAGTSVVWIVVSVIMLMSLTASPRKEPEENERLDTDRQGARRRHLVEGENNEVEEHKTEDMMPDDNRLKIAQEESREEQERRQLERENAAVLEFQRRQREVQEEEKRNKVHQRNQENQVEVEDKDGRNFEEAQKLQDRVQQIENEENSRNNVELKREPRNVEGQLSQEEEKRLRDEGFARHAFNQFLSDRIGLYRDVPDTRQSSCAAEKYDDDLPSASIVICFHNEAMSALLRTVKTALDRGNEKYIVEILLIDDASTFDELRMPLQEKASAISQKVHVVHLPQRHGLIRARVRGAKEAQGDVVVFLDSHCEANVDWLRPLLARIKNDRRHVVCPVIDIINTESMDYQASPLVRGGFTWALNFNWESIPFPVGAEEQEMIKPAKSPTMAGGLFAIHRQYFFDIGSYDMGMEVWGGENLEISFRIWMCGGTLEIIPCSRVGHIFRQRRPYDDAAGIDAMSQNGVRVAEVWMDDYKQLYYKERTFGSNSFGDISERLQLRQKLNCKSFQWYLDNIYPEKSVPEDFRKQQMDRQRKPNLEMLRQNPHDEQAKEAVGGNQGQGQFVNQKVRLCLSGSLTGNFRRKVYVANCASVGKSRNQMWVLTNKNELVLDGLCLDASKRLSLKKCDLTDHQSWHYSEAKHVLFHPERGQCLTVAEHFLLLSECSQEDKSQKWDVTEPEA